MNSRVLFNFLFGTTWTAGASAMVVVSSKFSNDPERLHRQSQAWAEGMLRGSGLSVELVQKTPFPTGKKVVIVANHRSVLDIIALFHVLPTAPVFLAKQELAEIPLLGNAMRQAGHVFINRGKRESAVASIDDAATKLTTEHPVVVFPEGTRRAGEGIGPFKKGAFHLARSAGALILPIGIRGAEAAWPKTSIPPLGGTASVHIGEAFDPNGMSLEDAIERARANVAELAGTIVANE